MPTTILTPQAEGARIYECMVLLTMNLSEKEHTNALHSLEQIFEEKGGKKLQQDSWGRHGLAFPIKGQREGQYMVYLYELPQGAAQGIDATLLLEKPVLRHLLVKIPKQYEFTSFADRQAAWEKEKEQETQKREQEREEVLKQKIVHRATKALPVKEVPPLTLPQVEGGSLEEKLTELISDEDLHL